MAIINGILIKVIAGFFYVEAGDNLYTCKAKGVLKNNEIIPVAGDKVEIDTENCTLLNVLKRKNYLIRPPVANIDKLFIVSSFASPLPNLLNIDKLTAIAEYNNIEPIIIFNKADIKSDNSLPLIYENAGYKTIVTSAFNKECKDKILPLLNNSVSVFTGNTGVGKSSLLNLIFDFNELKTGEISNKLGRGKHTTRHTELYKINGGYVADTPCFSSLDLELMQNIDADNLKYCFKEFSEYLNTCKFSDCSHTVEKGCNIIDAVNNGKISASRFESYKTIYNELKSVKEW